jgi:hypothetical protein
MNAPDNARKWLKMIALMELIDKLLGVRYFPFLSFMHLALQVMNFIVSVVIVVIMAAFYQLRSRLAIKDQEYRQLENLQTRTRLAVLQARINPHFLFNTLNTIFTGKVEGYVNAFSRGPGRGGSHGRVNRNRYDRAVEAGVGDS